MEEAEAFTFPLCLDVCFALSLFCMPSPLLLHSVSLCFTCHSLTLHPLLTYSSPTLHSLVSLHFVASSHAPPFVAECAYTRTLLWCHGPATATATATTTATTIATAVSTTIRTTVIIVIVVQSKGPRCVRNRHGDRNGCSGRDRGRSRGRERGRVRGNHGEGFRRSCRRRSGRGVVCGCARRRVRACVPVPATDGWATEVDDAGRGGSQWWWW